MLEFIKMFGLGMLYTILFPFILVIFAGYLVYVFGSYLVMESITFFGYFFGYTFSEEKELEKKLREMKEESDVKKNDVEENVKHVEEVKEEITYQYDDDTIIKYDDGKGSDEQWVALIF